MRLALAVLRSFCRGQRERRGGGCPGVSGFDQFRRKGKVGFAGNVADLPHILGDNNHSIILLQFHRKHFSFVVEIGPRAEAGLSVKKR